MRTILCVALVGHLLYAVSAYKLYQDSLPNGGRIPHPCLANYLWHGLGHKNAQGGGDRNPFGVDFAANSNKWDATLCQKDSDGDGLTNGQELGDPNCVWTTGTVPSQTTGLSHPGVCEPINSTACQAVNTWDFCTQATFDCPQLNASDVQNVTLQLTKTAVPNTETNYYCQVFDMANDTDYHIIASQPALDNEYVIHHILVFGCGDDPDNHLGSLQTAQPCNMQSQGVCGNIVAGWTVGSVGDCNTFPAGFKFGKTSYSRVLMQVHWNNPTLRSDYTDGSGITLHYTASLRTHDLATLTVGQIGLRIPSGQSSYSQKTTCSSSCTSRKISPTVNIVGVNLHMHYLGKEGYLDQYRGGAKIAELASSPSFSYDSPINVPHWPAKELMAGDELKLDCVFKSTSHSSYTYYGDGTQNEMCFAFISYYPAQNFTSCLNIGTYELCQGDPVTSIDGCFFSTTEDSQESLAYYNLMTKCDNQGKTCMAGCRSLLTENPHPCLTGNPKLLSEFISPVLNATSGTPIQLAFRSCDEVIYGHAKAVNSIGRVLLSLIALVVAIMTF